jgi:hypothetical protein
MLLRGSVRRVFIMFHNQVLTDIKNWLSIAIDVNCLITIICVGTD